MFQMLYADEAGNLYDYPGVTAVGRTGNMFADIDEADMIPLPEGASLVSVPEGIPVGVDRKGNFSVYDKDKRGKGIYAVGALLPQGFTRTLLPAFRRRSAKPLPLFGYAAVAWQDGEVYVAAVKTDEDRKWNPVHYNTPQLESLVEKAMSGKENNRILRQLAHCSLEYGCFTAQNIFYRRWEGGIPVSRACNAQCLGCISLQPAECCPSPQSRIDFKPSIEEIVELAIPHLQEAEAAIISFGQGCEGEPSTEAQTVSEAIRSIRRVTSLGTVNMNTNGGNTRGLEMICEAGIDSLRVSTISARPDTYKAYYCPQNYDWENVRASVRLARSQGIFVSLNLLTFPGLTDVPEETEALLEFIDQYDVNMVQIRNLNIDPDYLMGRMPLKSQEILGIDHFIERLQEIPDLIIGNYSKPVQKGDF